MISATTIGIAKVKKEMTKAIKKLGGSPKCQVGFGTDYAVPVHERVEVFHKVGQPLFLKTAMDEMIPTYKSELAERTRKHAGKSHPLHIALYEMGLELDAKAVPRVPVATGRLRSTHYVAPPKSVSGNSTPTKPGRGK